MARVNAGDRVSNILGHLGPTGKVYRCSESTTDATYPPPSSVDADNTCHQLHQELEKIGVTDVEVAAPYPGSEKYHRVLLSAPAVAFVADLVREFDQKVDQILRERQLRKIQLDATGVLPDFLPDTKHIREDDWQVAPLPPRLHCRHIDLGDVSPSNTEHFVSALNSPVHGIQTDFDDGHCPSWTNQLLGLYNVYAAVHGEMSGVPQIDQAPVLMLRPRAWNMVEHKMLVAGKEVPGPLFDFGMLMYHNAWLLAQSGSGPFFYLSKLEGYKEARLWNEVFVWTQHKLGLQQGTVKACVLIENVLASFETHEILYELRQHSLGLNCGIWDYSASFVNKFGHRPDFVLPDRSKYVSMERHFLKSYMDYVIQTCHQHGIHATGGMSALLLPSGDQEKYQQVMEKACRDKLREIRAGADGFMVYDLDLVKPMLEMFKKFAPTDNQWHVKRKEANVGPKDLLQMPSGGVTLDGLKHNIGVGILFIYSWIKGKGHYYYKGAVEDSATAEISRSQVWQWIRHQARLEDTNAKVTFFMVQKMVSEFLQDTFQTHQFSLEDRRQLVTAAGIFKEIVTKRDFPEFITTYLNQEHAWLLNH